MKVGVYFLFKKRKLLYIGRTKRWPVRITEHPEIDFDEAKLIECDVNVLEYYENRLISILKPKNNYTHYKRVYKRMTSKWITDNKVLIEESFKSGELLALINKAKIDLSYSPKYGNDNIIRRILKDYFLVFNQEIPFKKKKKRKTLTKK